MLLYYSSSLIQQVLIGCFLCARHFKVNLKVNCTSRLSSRSSHSSLKNRHLNKALYYGKLRVLIMMGSKWSASLEDFLEGEAA